MDYLTYLYGYQSLDDFGFEYALIGDTLYTSVFVLGANPTLAWATYALQQLRY
jgi:hypothetical protein